MRTTIDFSDDVFRQAKSAAAESGTTLTKLVEDAVKESLARRKQARRAGRVVFPVAKERGGVKAGVDLYSSASLLALMESGDDDS
jgi:hypothetical protein